MASESRDSAPVNARAILNDSYELVGYEDKTSKEKRDENEILPYSPCLIHSDILQQSNSPTQCNPLTQEVQYQV